MDTTLHASGPWRDRIAEMREQAQRYCSLIESADSLGRDAFVTAAFESLAALIAAASRLPDMSPAE